MVDKGQPKLVWQVDGIKAKYASPVIHEGRLYIPNEVGTLFCLDAKTGKQLWDFQYGQNTKGSPVWADGKIYITEVDFKFHILKPGDAECTELSKAIFRPVGGTPVELNGSPAIANGRIYFLTTTDLYCIGTKGQEAQSDKIPPQPAEAPKGDKAAWLQVVPADVAVHPGATVEFKVFAFDGKGQPLGEVEGEWSPAGVLPPVYPIGLTAPPPAKGPPPPVLQGTLGAMSGKSTTFTVAKERPVQFGRVVAKVGDLTGFARVRVAPALPFTADFTKVREGRAPAGWVNTAGKFSVVKLPTGETVLRKRNDNPSPLVARAHAYIGLPDQTDYTIESDVYGTKVRSDLPDIGIEANRYTLFLGGNIQQLRLYSWDALPRIDKTIQFPWKPNTWYRMKLTVKVDEKKAIVRGKVWERGGEEPKDWTIELEDPVPNREGAPALYGYAAGIIDAKNPGTEIYYANVKIAPNEKKE